MKSLERIIDYIKSWIYYPIMEKYFNERSYDTIQRMET